MHDKIFLKKMRTYLMRTVAATAMIACFTDIAAAQEKNTSGRQMWAQDLHHWWAR